jgi:hypothetical protein
LPEAGEVLEEVVVVVVQTSAAMGHRVQMELQG